MVGTRRRRIAATRIGISDDALFHWQRGDRNACERALDIMPFEVSPFTATDPEPPQWMLDEETYATDSGKPYNANSWRRAWALRQALIEAVGEPGPSDRHGRPLGVVLPPRERGR